jgi:hypothetical protein
MSKSQQYLPFDTSILANYTTWAQGIGTGLTVAGWTKVADAAGVTWANITSSAYLPVAGRPPLAGSIIYSAAWVGGTSYVGTAINGTGTFNVVTNSGGTFACILATANNISTSGASYVQNTTQSFAVTSTANAGSNTANYQGTFTGGASNAYVGYVFTITGFATGTNNGTFICTASTATQLTLNNPNATSQSASATATSSSANGAFFFNAQLTGSAIDGYAGLSLITTGFTVGADNATVTITHSHNTNSLSSSQGSVVTCVLAGTTATQASPTPVGTFNTAPVSDTFHWTPYNYEIWKSSGSESSTTPIYIKLVYTSNSSANQIPNIIVNVGGANASTANITGNATGEFYFGPTSATGQFDYFECDFSGDTDNFAMCLWRNGTSVALAMPSILFIDRARDSSGNALTTYFNVGVSSTSSASQFWTVFSSGVGSIVKITSGWPTIGPGSNSSLSNQGLTPTLPIFPLPGYVANPCLECIVMVTGDFTDGELINTVVYGTSHTYLMTKGNNYVMFEISQGCPGIRWE